MLAKCSDGSTVVGSVEFHGCIAEADDSLCVTCLKLLDFESEHVRKQKWKRSDRELVVPTCDVRIALIWADLGAGKVATLKPIR